MKKPMHFARIANVARRKHKSDIHRLLAKLPGSAVTKKKCSENRCTASTEVANKLILSGESLANGTAKAVDCVFFLLVDGKLDLVLVELKNKQYSVSDVIEKMSQSESHARSIASAAGVKIRHSARAVYARSHPRVSTAEYVLLERKGRVRLRRCGDYVESLFT